MGLQQSPTKGGETPRRRGACSGGGGREKRIWLLAKGHGKVVNMHFDRLIAPATTAREKVYGKEQYGGGRDEEGRPQAHILQGREELRESNTPDSKMQRGMKKLTSKRAVGSLLESRLVEEAKD